MRTIFNECHRGPLEEVNQQEDVNVTFVYDIYHLRFLFSGVTKDLI